MPHVTIGRDDDSYGYRVQSAGAQSVLPALQARACKFRRVHSIRQPPADGAALGDINWQDGREGPEESMKVSRRALLGASAISTVAIGAPWPAVTYFLNYPNLWRF